MTVILAHWRRGAAGSVAADFDDRGAIPVLAPRRNLPASGRELLVAPVLLSTIQLAQACAAARVVQLDRGGG